MKLQDKIKIHVEKHNIEYKEIAKQSDITTTALSNFLNEKSEIDFYSALRVVRFLFPDQETEIMSEYILTMQKPENLRYAMEYASFHGLINLLGILVGQELQSKNATNKEWASVYELDYQYKTGQIKVEELMIASKFLNIKNPEMIVLRMYFELKSYYVNYQYSYLLAIIYTLRQTIIMIKDEHIKESMLLRVEFISANANLFLGNISEAEKSAYYVLDSTNNLKGSIYHLLGYIHFHTDKDKSLEYLYKALDFSKKNMPSDVGNISKTIKFVSNHFNIKHDIPYTESISDILEYAHLQIKTNKLNQDNVLDNIKEDELNDEQKAYYYYLKGLCNNDIDFYYMSIRAFRKNGNKFFAMLSAKELLKLGERKSNIEAAIDLTL